MDAILRTENLCVENRARSLKGGNQNRTHATTSSEFSTELDMDVEHNEAG